MVLMQPGIITGNLFLVLFGNVLGQFVEHVVHHKEVIFMFILIQVFYSGLEQGMYWDHWISAHKCKERGVTSSKVQCYTIGKMHFWDNFVPSQASFWTFNLIELMSSL